MKKRLRDRHRPPSPGTPGEGRGEGSREARRAFTLVELLVVIGIITLLIGILMPALTRARAQANSVRCKANLRSLGQMLVIYENDNKGYLYPVGPVPLGKKEPSTLGTNVPPHERWPMKVFKIKSAPKELPYDTTKYPFMQPIDKAQQALLMREFPAEPFSHPALLCPTDFEPFEAHSYVLNKHLADNMIKASTRNFNGLKPSEVIMAGEKQTSERDYYMEAGANANDPNSEFSRVVEKYRHGLRLGSNYLYHDCHVDTKLPPEALTGIDPWDLRDNNQPKTK